MTLVSIVVTGDSMLPTFREGDKVTCNLFNGQKLVVGDVIVAQHPFKPSIKVFKRITAIDAQGHFFVEGDNPDVLSSEDSHNFGPISENTVLAFLR